MGTWWGCGASIPDSFFQALHKVETGGRSGPILGDNGEALGPFQIHYVYWKDSGVQGSYRQCADYDYSRIVVTAYLYKYAKDAIVTHNYEKMARIHNGGPQGHTKASTLRYWRRVQGFLLTKPQA